MKKHFLLVATGLFTVCLVNAQIKKGDVLLGGNVSFNTSGSKPDDTRNVVTSVGLYPSIGKAVKDNLVVGVNLGYRYQYSRSNSYTPPQITKNGYYMLGAFIRQYKELGNKFYLFAEGGLSGNYQTTKSYSEGTSVTPGKTWDAHANFYPGIAYFISRHVQIETGIQDLVYVDYYHSSGGDGTSKTSAFGVGTGLSQAVQNLLVGVKWVL